VQQLPNVKDIVLVGGGHTHALLIRMWAMKPVAGLRLTLISPQVHTPYSGMLPGLVAGHYSFDQTHIDLSRLCAWANVRFIMASATAIDPDNKTIQLHNRPCIEYDLCSIDIGSTPNNDITGCEEYAVPVKPISQFYQHWQNLQQQLLAHKTSQEPQSPMKIAVIGGGAGGIELIFAMNHWSQQHGCSAQFTLISRGKRLLSDTPKATQNKLQQALIKNNIQCHLNFDSQKISANKIHSENKAVDFDKAFYCTQASAAPWLSKSSLALTQQGFIKIKDTLQSSSHDTLFAAGDISHQVNNPRPKAGVYAVRMAPILFNNLINRALNKPLQDFKPQSDFLSLVALGDKYALASRKPFSFSGKRMWQWKDHIDVTFMNQFHRLPAMKPSLESHQKLDAVLQSQLGIKDIHELNMRCGGCGGKVGANVLSEVLSELKPYTQNDVLIGLDNSDDAAVLNIPNDQKLVQTIDHLKTFIDDPYLFGKLAALHALSDAFAMNAAAQSAQALVQLPIASETLQTRDMGQLMQGAMSVLNEHQCSLVGGHTNEEAQLSLGFCINALAQEKDLLHKQGCGEKELLILTQPLGTGALFAAQMRGLAKGKDIQHALAHMLKSNQQAGKIFQKFSASACTDVTGFGLLGHLVEMLKGNQLGATLHLDKIAALPGTLQIMQDGTFSSLQPKNVRLRRAIYNQDSFIQHPKYPLIFDPQTCGGLLASVSALHAADCINALKESGYTSSVIIGEITPLPEHGIITLHE
jgi:selenide,water dikinase